MSARFFLDTNVLIYTLDPRDPVKQNQAREIMRQGNRNRQMVLSTQVLQEFYVASTKKMGVEPLIAKQMLQGFSIFETIVISVPLIKEAIDCSALFQLSFWDALIIVAAESANCRELLSEDLNDGQVMRGVKILNPFAHYEDILSYFNEN